jgi:hypothetical protein
LRKATQLATKLKESSHLLWQSREPSVIESLHNLVAWQDWQLSCPMHKSGIPWIALLDEFANRTNLRAKKVPDDKGGPRPSIAFRELMIELSTYYQTRVREHRQRLNDNQFVELAEAVTGILRRVNTQLPDRVRLPPNKEDLRRRLLRLNRERRKSALKAERWRMQGK